MDYYYLFESKSLSHNSFISYSLSKQIVYNPGIWYLTNTSVITVSFCRKNEKFSTRHMDALTF